MKPAVIDRIVFDELTRTTGADFVRELVDTFIEEAPGMLGELRAAYAAGAADRFCRTAHSLKANALAFGAAHLTALARELEQQGFDAADTGLPALESAFEAAARELKGLSGG